MPSRSRNRTSDRNKLPAASGYVLKVTLRGVKPGVWRRLRLQAVNKQLRGAGVAAWRRGREQFYA